MKIPSFSTKQLIGCTAYLGNRTDRTWLVHSVNNEAERIDKFLPNEMYEINFLLTPIQYRTNISQTIKIPRYNYYFNFYWNECVKFEQYPDRIRYHFKKTLFDSDKFRIFSITFFPKNDESQFFSA